MKKTTVCEENKCSACYACVDACPQKAIRIEDSLESYNAVIDKEICVDCGRCYSVCQVLKPLTLESPQKWVQGWAISPNIRRNSSSGGLATAITEAFLLQGGSVCSCVFRDGKFTFEMVNKNEDFNKFAKSKYVKSSLANVYSLIDQSLKTNKVLFIGLPCQVAALKKRFSKKDNLYTVDLICHGTPSIKLLEMSLADYGFEMKDISNIDFRRDNRFGLEVNGKKILPAGVLDRFLYAFLSGLNYTRNCYECQYARIERIGDITLGDSWGTDMVEEFEKGISLCLCQNSKGEELLNIANLELYDVDIDRAIKSNHQLMHPTVVPKEREKFFNSIKEGKSFNSAVFRCYKKALFRQDIKGILVKLRLYKK